jgi:nitrogen fixation/metabolism regulation signal transduction histidine kinase
MVGSAPKRVMCMTCDSEHNYRAPKSNAPAKKTTRTVAQKKTGAKKAATSSQAEWRTKVESGAPFTNYTISETFREGQLVRHKKFGDGYVVGAAIPGKITVAFIDGEKTLVHGAQA